MNPKLNKLITLLLLLGTFAFLMELESKVTALAKQELSEWASLLPIDQSDQLVNHPNAFPQSANKMKNRIQLIPKQHSDL